MRVALVFALSLLSCICLSSCTKRFDFHETVTVDPSLRAEVANDLRTKDPNNAIVTIFHDSDESLLDQGANVKCEIIIDNASKYVINLNDYVNITITPGEHTFVVNYLNSSDELLKSVKNIGLYNKGKHYYIQTKRSVKYQTLNWYVPYIFAVTSENEAMYRILESKKK